MDIRKLQRAIVDGLEDVKGQNIVVFNTEHLSPLFERVIIASGTSNRQTKALAASVRDAVKAAGGPPPRVEGEANGEWIIVDCGPAVVHVMQPTFREYYHLEELWGDKPVRMRLGAEAAPAPRASRVPERTDATQTPARKAAAPKPALKKIAGKKTARKIAPSRAPATSRGSGVRTSSGVVRSGAAKPRAATRGAAAKGRSSARPAAKKTAKTARKTAARTGRSRG